MILFKHQEIGFPFELSNGDIIDLSIENPNFYRSFIRDLSCGESDFFVLSEEGEEIDFSKSALLVRDLFDLDPNSKKILTAIYKKIDKTFLSPERRTLFDEINAKIGELMMDISSDFEGAISFNDCLTLPQILGMIDFKFDYDDSTFLSSFISYLKAWREATDLKLVFVLNLFSLLEESEIEDLATEISYLGLSMINIGYFPLASSNKKVKKVRIDSDLCEIY